MWPEEVNEIKKKQMSNFLMLLSEFTADNFVI